MSKRLAVLAVLVLACSGCTLFKGAAEAVGLHKTVPRATLPPQPGPKLQEGHREMAAVVRDYLLTPVLDEIAGYRALMAACQGVLVADHGAPARVPEGVPEIARTLDAVQAAQAAHQTRLDLDAQQRMEDAGKPADASVSVTSGMLGTKLILTGIGLSGVGLVGVLGWLWRKGKKLAVALAASQTSFGQVVASVGQGLAVLPHDQAKAVKAEMSKVQDTATEKAVLKAKAEV